MEIIRKAQIAAQIVAVMQSDFSRPDAVEMEEILNLAKSQVRDVATALGSPAIEAMSLDHYHLAKRS